MDPAAAQNLRSLVHDCLAKHLYDAAIFFADKLVTLSSHSPAEVYTLAQAFFVDRQYRRCLQLLRTADFTDKDIRFRYLAARCAAALLFCFLHYQAPHDPCMLHSPQPR